MSLCESVAELGLDPGWSDSEAHSLSLFLLVITLPGSHRSLGTGKQNTVRSIMQSKWDFVVVAITPSAVQSQVEVFVICWVIFIGQFLCNKT